MGQQVVDELKAQVKTLEKEIAGSKAMEELALAHVQKAKDTNNNLRKEVEAERSSGAALAAQVSLLTKRLEEATTVSLTAAEMYRIALAGFGRATSPYQLMPPPSLFLLG